MRLKLAINRLQIYTFYQLFLSSHRLGLASTQLHVVIGVYTDKHKMRYHNKKLLLWLPCPWVHNNKWWSLKYVKPQTSMVVWNSHLWEINSWGVVNINIKLFIYGHTKRKCCLKWAGITFVFYVVLEVRMIELAELIAQHQLTLNRKSLNSPGLC